jgi:hypothetical protein
MVHLLMSLVFPIEVLINEEHIDHYNDKIGIVMVMYIPRQTSIILPHALIHSLPDDLNVVEVVEEFVLVSNFVF